ncbi:reticulocyte binding protein [Ectopseudomonas mendocina]|uniref:hypothetical protein n=1 Tax=Ectopseudomonas mendocina TaxID=300 RepID=UPI000E07A62C|nr:hypothetical protein [Pseudomonas mendocina]SUD34358.1 reticulocyte binding protein [Pseudomonas mendocina]
MRKQKISLLDKSKNLARGALSNLASKSTPARKLESWSQEQKARGQINRALAFAKKNLKPSDLLDFERWLSEQLAVDTKLKPRTGLDLTSLGIFPPDITPKKLSIELGLVKERLERNKELFEGFVLDAQKLMSEIRIENWREALETLKAIEGRDGFSYWLIETRLSLLEKTEGIEAIKNLISQMSEYAYGILKFHLYYLGVRNEPAQNSSRFKVNVKKKIEESELPLQLKDYSKYRLYSAFDLDEGALPSVLACEQVNNLVDLLITGARVSRHILLNKKKFGVEDYAAAESLMQTVFNIGFPFIGATSKDDFDNGDQELFLAQEAIYLALSEGAESGAAHGIYKLITKGISSAISSRSDGAAAEELSKFLLNLNWLPESIQIGDIATLPSLPRLMLEARNPNSLLSSSSAMYKALLTGISVASESSDSQESIDKIRKIYDVSVEPVETYSERLEEFIRQNSNTVASDISRLMAVEILLNKGLIEDCVSHCAIGGIENYRLIQYLPLMDLFQGLRWPTIKNMCNPLDLSIALDHYLSLDEDRKIKTFKRYAIEELLREYDSLGVEALPSALSKSQVALSKIQFFASEVCDLQTIELLPGMGESRRTRQTRSALLKNVAELKPFESKFYLQEAKEIDAGLELDDGLDVLDENKVYIDESAILKLINQELGADFKRYKKLVESGVGVSESLINVFRGFKNPSAKTFQIPKNDADDLLGILLGSALEKFQLDPTHGLDIILGRRIRHGTIASEIRGVLEPAELIGQRPRAGAEYAPPNKAVQLAQRLDAKRKKSVYASFSRFSDSIDQLIALLRDEYFHVKSKSKPRGIFDVQIDALKFALARTIAQSCSSIEQLSKELLEIFWLSLSTRAEAVRPTVETEIKRTLQICCQKLIEDLKSHGVNDPAFHFHVLQISEELQRRASTIANWIRVPRHIVDGKTYSMKYAVDVAVALVKGKHPGFQPEVTSVVPSDLELDVHGFSIVEDALHLALVNIYQHSGIRVGNKVGINITHSRQDNLISFVIENDVSKSSRTPEKDGRINSTRTIIQRRAYSERARFDKGGSGLCRLAGIVMQSDKTKIIFDYVEPNRFQLKFDLVWIGFSDVPQLSFLDREKTILSAAMTEG